MNSAKMGFRSELVFCLPQGEENYQLSHIADGLLVLEKGYFIDIGSFDTLSPLYPHLPITHFKDAFIVPGFIDGHIHFPQLPMVASYGKRLLHWLEKYTYPTEALMTDLAYVNHLADRFLDLLLASGTTAAVVFTTVHETTPQILFEKAFQRQMRIRSGKVCMDRNAPAFILDTPASAVSQTRRLMAKWHGKGRCEVAIMPRFAPTSTEAQLTALGELQTEAPQLPFHTHLAENKEEVAWVKQLFPFAKDYLHVYEKFGFVHEKSSFAHGVELTENQCERLSAKGASIACCPAANLFLGSGLFPFRRAKQAHLKWGWGSDIGAGNYMNLWQVMGDGYKVSQIQHDPLTPADNFYAATLGAARALGWEDKVGTFQKGMEGDFVVISPTHGGPLLQTRLPTLQSIEDKLFALMLLGDDRIIQSTYVMGNQVGIKG